MRRTVLMVLLGVMAVCLPAVASAAEGDAVPVDKAPASGYVLDGGDVADTGAGGDASDLDATNQESDGQAQLQASKISYTVDGTTLTIKGSGAMADYNDEPAPWSEKKDSITKIIISSGITSIGSLAFQEFSMATEVSIPASVTRIGEAAFYECSALTDVKISQGSKLKQIEDGAFCGCSELAALELPDSVESLGAFFLQETKIETFTIPQKTEEVAGNAFGSSNISAIQVTEGNKAFDSDEGVLFSKGWTDLILYLPKKPDQSYTVPAATRKICENAFNGAKNLKTIDLGNVTEFEESAFSFTGLQSVTLPDTLKSMGDMVFWECTDLVSIDFGNGLRSIEYSTFYNCTALREVNFGGVSEIGQRAFAECGLESLVLPESVKVVGAHSFGDCPNLTSVTAKGLKYVGFTAFYNDTSLTDVTLNEGVTDIYGYAFKGCDNLKSVEIPESCTFVHELAFPGTTQVINKNPDMMEYGHTGWLDTLTITGERNYTAAYQVLDKTNAERAKEGLSPLKMDRVLLEDAMLRAAETVVHFSHGRPNGDSVVGTYSFSNYYPGLNIVEGENIAYGSSTASGAMKQWMNSKGHRENILEPDWTSIGVGCFEYEGRCFWVQCFSQQTVDTEFDRPDNCRVTTPIHIDDNNFVDAGNDDANVTFKFNIEGKSTLAPGGQTALDLYKEDIAFDPESVDWVSSNPDVAEIDETGLVTAKACGTTKITASSRGYKRASLTIRVGTPNPMTVKAVKKTVKFKKLKKKALKVSPLKVSGAAGKVTYKVAGGSAKSKKALKVSAGTGKVTVKKGTKKGTYKITVRVTAAGTNEILPVSKKVAVTVRVK